MRRGEIPDALLKARRADIDCIPASVLAKLTRADLVNRLVAAGEYRHRASVPHLDGDLYRLRIGQASEVLTASDPKRAAELVKGAGVGVTIGTGRTVARTARPAARTAYPAVTAARAEAAARQLAAAGAFGPVVKAAEYERKAYAVTDPETRRGYLELAAQERQKAGMR